MGTVDIRIDGRHALLEIVAWFMNRRSPDSVCTGDHPSSCAGTVMRLGGYPPIDLMEDIALSSSAATPRPLHRAPAPLPARRWKRVWARCC
jgi:hypothetical protein